VGFKDLLCVAIRNRLADTQLDTLCIRGSRAQVLRSLDDSEALRALIEFLVCVPVSGWLELSLGGVDSSALDFPFELVLGGIFV
jgi:hypothetical protein